MAQWPPPPLRRGLTPYFSLRQHVSRFDRPDACDLLICDEAHRLKNDETLTNKALASLSCRRRVLLSGTPMQNDLEEFFAMVNFTNPDLLGTVSQFRRKFQQPILTGREPDATDKERALGERRSHELAGLVNEFILRRTNTVLSEHLPPKTVSIVCCRMSPLQRKLYNHFLHSKAVQGAIEGKQVVRARASEPLPGPSLSACRRPHRHPHRAARPLPHHRPQEAVQPPQAHLGRHRRQDGAGGAGSARV